jgi:aryl-alcohol dehydrogenase-like predicted oxidoreductase
MEIRSLGRSGIEVTRFIYGAGSIGGLGSAIATRGLGLDAGQGMERLAEAYGLGIRVIDTADAYGGGTSEDTVGRWLAETRPGDVLVQTKVGGITHADQPGPHIERQLAQSIRRLGRVDLYLSHLPDPATPIEETLTAFAAARGAGLIRAFGICNVDVRLLEAFLETAATSGLPRPEFVQNGLSLLRRADERDLLPLAAAEGIGYMAFSPLAGGMLSDRYLAEAAPPAGSRMAVVGDLYYAGMHTRENLVRVAQLRDLARKNGISTSGLALAWLRAHPVVTASIVSPSTQAQWRAVSEAISTDLNDDLLGEASEIFR